MSRVMFFDRDGEPFPGLPDDREQVTMHKSTDAPHADKGEWGDICMGEGGQRWRCWVRMKDGWHTVAEMQADTETESNQAIAGDGSIVSSWDYVTQVNVTLDGVSAEPIDPVAKEGPAMPGTMNNHPFGRTDHTEERGWWCDACGAETHDADLFREVGCAV